MNRAETKGADNDTEAMQPTLIPTDRYTSAEWMAKENEKVWPYSWQIACSVDHVAEPGDFFEYRVGWLSLLIVRGDDGVLDYSVTLALPALSEDGWVLAEAGRGLDTSPSEEALGVYALIAPEYSPIGFTNPVLLDVDGDGAWTAPGLP